MSMTSDPDSRWPPLCWILKSLCYSPVCCSVSQQLRTLQRTSLSVLGAVHIMVGLLHIGLGAILLLSHSDPVFIQFTCFPLWMGPLFITFGITWVLSERYPSPCLVAFAMAAVVLCSVYVREVYLWFYCQHKDYYPSDAVTPSYDAAYIQEACLEGKTLVRILLRSIVGVLIVLSAVELCVAVASALLGIEALRRTSKGQNESSDDPEHHRPLLEDVSSEPPA